MSKRQTVLQVLQFSAIVALVTSTANAQLPALPNGRLHAPLVRLPAGDFDVATAALAGPENKPPAYVAALPTQLNGPSAPTSAAQNFDPLAPPQIDTPAVADSWAPPLPPEKSAQVKAEKPRLFQRIRERWARGGANSRGGNDPADQLPKMEASAGSTPIAATAPQPTAKRGWFLPTQTGSQKRY